MNPYLDRNAKNDPEEAIDFPAHRQSFLRAYVESLEGTRPTVVIVGEAPGLDGCGYCGIAFTGEHNAILPDYHRSGPPYQHEDSAMRPGVQGRLATHLARALAKVWL